MASGFEAVAYAAANARVRGLRTQLLTDSDWSEVLAAPDLPQALQALQGTPYGVALTNVEGGDHSLVSLERRLMGVVADNVLKAMAFVRGVSHSLLDTWWGHFELENLKVVFRGVEQGMSSEDVRSFLIPLGPHSRIDWEDLLHERSVSGLVEQTEGTHYVNPLRNALHMYAQFGTLFPLEVAMDIRYYRDIPAAIRRLPTQERPVATKVLGTYLDILNILWAFRFRVYFQLSAEQIVNFTIWHTLHTDVSLIQAIGTGATIEYVVDRVWGNRVDLSPLSQATTEVEQLPLLELSLLRFWRGIASQATVGYPFGLGPILGYLVTQELDVNDLVTILEAKGLGWDQDRIRQRLIRTAAAQGRRWE